MSKSFALVNGDLSPSGSSYATVSGRDKLLQDLKCWILERVGTDPATPTYGSNLDGTALGGQGAIGGLMTELAIGNVKTEVVNLISSYQQAQLAKMSQEVVQYDGQTTLDPDEIIEAISSVDVTLFATILIVQVTLLTLSGSDIRLAFPVNP